MNLPTQNATAVQAPWYRQFWPWFIIALPATIVVASVYMLVLANQYADDLVVDDYYKEGLAINQQLERDLQARQLGLQAQLFVNGTDSRQINVQLRGTIHVGQLQLRLSHPIEASADRILILKRISDQNYMGQMSSPLSGSWYWVLDAGEQSTWRLTGEQYF